MRSAMLDFPGLQALVDELRSRGRRVVAPIRRDSAIVLAEIDSISALPRGFGDEQTPGRYRMVERGDEALFGFAAPAQSAKPWLFPPDELIWRGIRGQADQHADAGTTTAATDQPLALLGVRGCDLAAIGIHDAVLRGRAAVDVRYASRRDDTFLVAVTCGSPASTCFCASMGTGPKPGPGADIVLTELLEPGPHRFLAEADTAAGEEVLAAIPSAPAVDADVQAVAAVVAGAVDRMGRQLDTTDLRGLLYASAESPRWDDVAERCLSCANCTMVCPTCFCTNIEDVSDLTGAIDERHRVWDSCFSLEYSRLHGGAVRTSAAARYRQWLTHKLGSWVDQFGTSGCVGCGRCITWCPVGIDLTAEVGALREEAALRGDSLRRDSGHAQRSRRTATAVEH